MVVWTGMLAAAAAAAAPASPLPVPAPMGANVAFCFVRDAPHHDFLTPPAPAGTDLRAAMEAWLAYALPALTEAQRAQKVQCDPDLPRSLYDGWKGWTKLSDGDVFSEPFDWPADWYLRRPPAKAARPANAR